MWEKEEEKEEETEELEIVEGTVAVEVAEACFPLECAGEGKLPPLGCLAPQKSSLRVHVAQGQPEECLWEGEAPWPGAAVEGEQCLAAACPCSSSCPSSAAYKTIIPHFIHVSLSSYPRKVITYFLTSISVAV